MGDAIEVRVAGAGTVRGDHATEDGNARAQCALCGSESDAVASLGAGAFACANCLRARLDALSVARWRLRESRKSGLPWGKVSG